MKDTHKTIAFILGFSGLYGYCLSVFQSHLGSTIFSHIASASVVSGIIYLSYLAWCSCLWKIPILSNIVCFVTGLEKLPNISGEWQTKYVSSYTTPSGRRKRGHGSVYIQQQYDKISIRDGVFPKSSKFQSFFVGLQEDMNDNWSLVYAYRNTPDKPFDNALGGSHTGFAYLEIKGADHMEGYYATDKLRHTYGDIMFDRTK